MEFQRLPFLASITEYEKQADALLQGHSLGDAAAIDIFHNRHPRFLRTDPSWLPLEISDAEIKNTSLSREDARLALARWYDFLDWAALAQHVTDVTTPGSAVYLFESAIEAVVNGDLVSLEALLRDHPELVHARSARVTQFDPAVHRATLLHYVAANGVEGYRQKTPPNAVEIATALLKAGAEPDSLASLYGGECTTMALLVSSCHPANAGFQVPLVHVLVNHGAAVEHRGSGNWTSPLLTALAFGYRGAAEALVERGASIPTLPAAAGMGRFEEAKRLLPEADAESRHRALALAAQLGQVEIVRLLLDAGEDPDRYNPEGLHAHSTPMHQAALAGHQGVVRLLVERGARTDIRDTLWNGTPLGWANHNGQKAMEAYLRTVSST